MLLPVVIWSYKSDIYILFASPLYSTGLKFLKITYTSQNLGFLTFVNSSLFWENLFPWSNQCDVKLTFLCILTNYFQFWYWNENTINSELKAWYLYWFTVPGQWDYTFLIIPQNCLFWIKEWPSMFDPISSNSKCLANLSLRGLDKQHWRWNSRNLTKKKKIIP